MFNDTVLINKILEFITTVNLIMEFSITEYYLEDCIQMLGFIPPPSDKKKKKDRDELGEEMDQEVEYLFTQLFNYFCTCT